MRNMIGNLIKNNIDINDQIIAISMLSSGKESAELYLKSALTSTTPEIRAIYSASLIEMVEGHTAVTELCINKGWIKPYCSSTEQLIESFKNAQSAIDKKN